MKYDHAFELITVTDQNVTDFITNNVVEKNNCDWLNHIVFIWFAGIVKWILEKQVPESR